jgi:hypothetical protein
MNDHDTILKLLRKIIREEMKYSVPRIGQILDNKDPKKKGRVLVAIPDFSWITRDKAAWCFPKDKKAIITPGIGEYVLVEWIGGDRNMPIYSGNAMEMKDMLPRNYNKNENTQIIFQSVKKLNDCIKYDEKTGNITIKVSGNLTLETSDSSLWKPCIIGNCLFSGANHGGTVAGIVKLTGG